MRNSLVALVLLLTFELAIGEPLDDALAEIDKGNYKRAYTMLEPLAKQGNAEAQFLAGRMLTDSTLDYADLKQGVIWLQKAVDNRHREAAQTLAKMYLSGHIVKLDAEKGSEYLMLAEQFRLPGQSDEECD